MAEPLEDFVKVYFYYSATIYPHYLGNPENGSFQCN